MVLVNNCCIIIKKASPMTYMLPLVRIALISVTVHLESIIQSVTSGFSWLPISRVDRVCLEIESMNHGPIDVCRDVGGESST